LRERATLRNAADFVLLTRNKVGALRAKRLPISQDGSVEDDEEIRQPTSGPR
jgi:hypothetical protein